MAYEDTGPKDLTFPTEPSTTFQGISGLGDPSHHSPTACISLSVHAIVPPLEAYSLKCSLKASIHPLLQHEIPLCTPHISGLWLFPFYPDGQRQPTRGPASPLFEFCSQAFQLVLHQKFPDTPPPSATSIKSSWKNMQGRIKATPPCCVPVERTVWSLVYFTRWCASTHVSQSGSEHSTQ